MKMDQHQFELLTEYLNAMFGVARAEASCTDGGDNRHYDWAREKCREAYEKLEKAMVET